jgi:hypothetical protein
MSKSVGVLEVVTDSFNLKDHGRSDGNGRNYLVDSVKRVIDSDFYKERLKLGELYGYFGHSLRQLSNKMDLDEVTVIEYQGKPVVIESVPSNRTIFFDVSNEGIVTHKQEILDTPAGRAVKAMRDAGVGGWSWAVKGVPTALGAIAKSFHGFDFVKHPSYINVEKQQAMFESVGVSTEDELLDSLFESAGFSAGEGSKLLGILTKRAPSVADYEASTMDIMMLESALLAKDKDLAELLVEKEQRSFMMFEALKALPIFTSERQLQALCNMASDEDKAIVKALFEGLGRNFDDLPIGSRGAVTVTPAFKGLDDEIQSNAISFDGMGKSPFSKGHLA